MILSIQLLLDVQKIIVNFKNFSLINKSLIYCNLNYIIYCKLSKKSVNLKFNKKFNYLDASFFTVIHSTLNFS